MPAKSMVEWIAGANLPRSYPTRKEGRGPRKVVEVKVSADFGRSVEDVSKPSPCTCKKVHFEGDQALKSAMKKPAEVVSKPQPEPDKEEAKIWSDERQCTCDCKACQRREAEHENSAKGIGTQENASGGGGESKQNRKGKNHRKIERDKSNPKANYDSHEKSDHKADEVVKQRASSPAPQPYLNPTTVAAPQRTISEFVRLNMSRLIQPSRAEVVIREDVIECANDPRPNAFFDAKTGILRVYHGPNYGNPMASVVPLTNAHIPIGTPAPLGYPPLSYPMPWGPAFATMSGALPADWSRSPSSKMPQRGPPAHSRDGRGGDGGGDSGSKSKPNSGPNREKANRSGWVSGGGNNGKMSSSNRNSRRGPTKTHNETSGRVTTESGGHAAWGSNTDKNNHAARWGDTTGDAAWDNNGNDDSKNNNDDSKPVPGAWHANDTAWDSADAEDDTNDNNHDNDYDNTYDRANTYDKDNDDNNDSWTTWVAGSSTRDQNKGWTDGGSKNRHAKKHDNARWQPDQNQTALSGGSWADDVPAAVPMWGDTTVAASSSRRKGGDDGGGEKTQW
ncbi:MAG: hypothetical protein M1818_007228 [Claussenomyces sp. TS43310]|nr:MAG: hypothetical protein M1818_007228 [Claussenomyces sp. TS43310]